MSQKFNFKISVPISLGVVGDYFQSVLNSFESTMAFRTWLVEDVKVSWCQGVTQGLRSYKEREQPLVIDKTILQPRLHMDKGLRMCLGSQSFIYQAVWGKFIFPAEIHTASFHNCDSWCQVVIKSIKVSVNFKDKN